MIFGGGGGRGLIEHEMFVFFLRLSSKTCLILRRTERDMIENEYLTSRNVPVIHVRFQ
jgi:hypothetical protein